MILRAFQKKTAPNPSLAEEQDVHCLAEFTDLPEQMRQTIARHSEKISVPPGELKPDDEEEFLYYLASGELYLSREGKPAQRLGTSDPGARYPLPGSPWRLNFRSHATCLKVPRRYLDLIRNQHPSPTTDIELREGDAEGNLYLDVHESLKKGHYDLPVLPDLAVRIGKVIDDPNTNNEDIARLIQLDPALSARLMSVVNSAAFAGATPIRSLQVAVARLGRQQVRNLVFSCIMKDLFQTESRLLRKQMQELWQHSCRVAAISSVLARYTPGLDPDQALLAGLIHDIGVIPLLQTASDNPDLLEAPAVLNRLISEMKAEVGQLTLRAWHLDEELCRLAYQAEDWFRLGTAVPDYLDAVLVAQLHDFVGSGPDSGYPPIDTIPAFNKLALGKLTPHHSASILEQAEQEIDEVAKLLR